MLEHHGSKKHIQNGLQEKNLKLENSFNVDEEELRASLD